MTIYNKEISCNHKMMPAIAVNSMIVGSRDYKEAFELAAIAEEKLGINTFVDLRSCRNPSTDNEKKWAGAYENSSFDIIDDKCIQRAVSLAKKFNTEVIGTSVYLEAFSRQDVEYGKLVIEKAIKLTSVAPDNTIIIRIVGGNKKDIINENFKDVIISNLIELSEYALELENNHLQNTGLYAKIIFGVEIHQGQYPENIEDAVKICEKLRHVPEEIRDHIGIIEDPANRYISTTSEYLNPTLAAQKIYNAMGKIIYYHLKDVKYINTWVGKNNKQQYMEGFQIVGNGNQFEFNNNIFEWRLPLEGDINFQECIEAALTYSSPPHGIIGFSTEHVPASKNKHDALEIFLKYSEIIEKVYSGMQNINISETNNNIYQENQKIIGVGAT